MDPGNLPTLSTKEQREGFENSLRLAPNFASLVELKNWVVRALRVLGTIAFDAIELLTDRASYTDGRILRLEEIAGKEASHPPASAAAPQPPTQQPSKPRARTRCQRCHALGHDTTDCRTKDPVATKKRVAKNARVRKAANDSRSTLPQPTFPFSYPFTPYTPPLPAPAHSSIQALFADATEMRRRTAQSARDKRRRPRAPAVPAAP